MDNVCVSKRAGGYSLTRQILITLRITVDFHCYTLSFFPKYTLVPIECADLHGILI